MNERLRKQWAVTEKLLSAAALHVRGTAGFADCAEALSRNEPGLALEALAAEGEYQQVGADFWNLLKKVAEVIGRQDQVIELRRKRQHARTRAVPTLPQRDSAGYAGPRINLRNCLA